MMSKLSFREGLVEDKLFTLEGLMFTENVGDRKWRAKRGSDQCGRITHGKVVDKIWLF